MELMQTDLPEPVAPAVPVRHLGQVGDDQLAVNVPAQRERHLGLAFPFRRLDDVAKQHLGLDAVGHLDANGAATGYRCEDVNSLGLDGCGNVVKPVMRSSFTPGAGCSS